jgi:hypothetical protein
MIRGLNEGLFSVKPGTIYLPIGSTKLISFSDMYFKINYANIFLFADNIKLFRVIKSVDTTNYQELTEHARI